MQGVLSHRWIIQQEEVQDFVQGSCPGDNPATLQACCQCIHNAQATYNYRTLEPMETVQFSTDGGVTKTTLNCAVSGFEEGETSEGDRTYTSAYMAEVIKGHIRELIMILHTGLMLQIMFHHTTSTSGIPL
jgi:hypothetical protein